MVIKGNKPKNRSSKHEHWMRCGHSLYRSMPNAQLEDLAKGDKNGKNKDWEAEKELNRRQKKREKKA